MNLFRDLTKEEEKEFRASARENYLPFTEISTVWHPIYCEECAIINRELHDKGVTKQV